MPAPAPSRWLDPARHVPRRDEAVHIRTRSGHLSQARFRVDHTDRWPSGVSWVLATGNEALPFDRVTAWAPLAGLARPSDAEEPAIVRDLLTEIERTRDVLDALPPDHLGWTPHPEVASAQVLAWRLVRVVQRIRWIAARDHVELSVLPRLALPQSPEEIAETYAAAAAKARDVLPTLTAATLRAPWVLTDEGVEAVRVPRGDALRAFGVRPLVYHRAEMGVLLAALGRPVPHPYPEWRLAPPA